jgi:hypothetical protein
MIVQINVLWFARVAKEHVNTLVLETVKKVAKNLAWELANFVVDLQLLVQLYVLAPVKKRILVHNPNKFKNNEKRLFRHSIPPRVLQEFI